MIVTPIDYTEIFATMGMLFSNDRVPACSNGKSLVSLTRKQVSLMHKFIVFFQDLCL